MLGLNPKLNQALRAIALKRIKAHIYSPWSVPNKFEEYSKILNIFSCHSHKKILIILSWILKVIVNKANREGPDQTSAV